MLKNILQICSNEEKTNLQLGWPEGEYISNTFSLNIPLKYKTYKQQISPKFVSHSLTQNTIFVFGLKSSYSLSSWKTIT